MSKFDPNCPKTKRLIVKQLEEKENVDRVFIDNNGTIQVEYKKENSPNSISGFVAVSYASGEDGQPIEATVQLDEEYD